MSIITISREYGAGGHTIGKRVAQELGIEIYDRDIIRNAVLESGLDASVIERKEEDLSSGDAFLRMIAPSAYIDQRETIHNIERHFILSIASKGPCVILGRCADQILDEAGIEALNVFIYADIIHRAQRVAQLINTTDPTEVQRAIKKVDASRHSYYQHFAARHWGVAANYSISLDSGLLGTNTCVQLICEAARSLDARQ